jgi:predicted small lipoprotein YifL
MHSFFRQAILAGILLTLINVWGCGLRGDLYLPEDESTQDNAPASTEAVQSDAVTEDMQGFSSEPVDEDEDEDEKDIPDEQITPDTGAPLLP